MKLTDSWAHELWVDRHGLHDGRWKHRDEDRLAAEFDYKIHSGGVLSRKRRLPGRGWKTEIKEPGPLER